VVASLTIKSAEAKQVVSLSVRKIKIVFIHSYYQIGTHFQILNAMQSEDLKQVAGS